MSAKVSTRILLCLATGGEGTTDQVYHRLADVHLKTVQGNLSALSASNFVHGERIPLTPLKVWSITEVGRAELRRQGYRTDDEPVSAFGSFGQAIGRVPSVFHLGAALQ